MHVLKIKTDKTLPPFIKQVLDFKWEDKMYYAYWLAETHRYVTHTVKLLEFSAERLKGEMRDCMIHHRDEELGHELMALRDLHALGYKLEQFPELPVTQSFYSTMYNLIEEDPSSLIGYAMALEGISAKSLPTVAKRLIKTYGHRSSTFVILHAKVDQEHSNDLKILDYLSPAQVTRNEQIMIDSLHRYSEYLKDISKSSHLLSKKAA